MPSDLFVGASNHFQSIMLAEFFMRDEQVESLEWVFSEFLNTMGRLVLKSIFTGMQIQIISMSQGCYGSCLKDF